MKTLGILGGMGPMATACFMERITAMTAADTDQEQIPVIVYSNTQIPDRSAYLLGRPQAENPVTALRQTAHFLDGACDYIAVCDSTCVLYADTTGTFPCRAFQYG